MPPALLFKHRDQRAAKHQGCFVPWIVWVGRADTAEVRGAAGYLWKTCIMVASFTSVT
jgi:hypothetical protein